jgi:rubrerythrin
MSRVSTGARKPAAGKAAAMKSAPRKKAAKRAVASGSAAHSGGAAVVAPRTLTEFMAQAWEMEIEAAQRYSDFADAMEMHNNREVAAMFRTMAGYETKHADEIMATMGWSEAPPLTPRSGAWPGYEAPETAAGDDVHYLMQPWHALQLALAAEQRAERFFAELVRVSTVAAVRNAALALQAEEREHVALVKAWMKKVPKPDRNWALDPDPPRYTD